MDSTGTYSDKGIDCGAGKECKIIAPVQGICPESWRLPSKNDWERLISYIGGRDYASTKLKSEAWVGFGGIKGTNDYGFSAIPSGYRDSDGTYDSEGLNFWSSTEESNIYVYAMRFRDGDDWGDVTERSREAAKPVRCVKDLVEEPIEGTLKDTRDGKTYKTIKIGNYTWMAENLNYETEESICYENSTDKCDKYGRLYTWVDARNDPNCGFEQKCSSTEKAKDICPDGWRLPTSSEFRTLLEDVGGNGFAGHRLKSTSGWDPYKNAGNGIDAVGFTALAAGATSMHGVSGDEGRFTYFWSASESDSWNGVYLFASYYGIDASTGYEYKNNYFSVRCIKVKKIP